jgi:hypothetical protein
VRQLRARQIDRGLGGTQLGTRRGDVLRTWSIDRLGECGLHLVKPRAAGIERHARIIEKLLRGRVAGGEALLPLERRFGVGERGLRGDDVRPRLVDLLRPRAGQQHVKLRLGGVAPCDGEIEGALVGGRVELRDGLAPPHPVALPLRHVKNGTFGIERQIDLANLDVAVERARRLRPGNPLYGQPGNSDDGGDCDDGEGDTSHAAGSWARAKM